jgi:hypothetical protein
MVDPAMTMLPSAQIAGLQRRLEAILAKVSALAGKLRPATTGRTIQLVAGANQNATQALRYALATLAPDKDANQRQINLVCSPAFYLCATLPGKDRADRQGARLREHFSVATPFQLDDVVFASGIAGTGAFQVRYLTRATVAAWQEIAAERGHAIAQIIFETPRFTTRLKRDANSGTLSHGRLRWDLIAGCMGLGLLANAAFFHMRMARVEQLEETLSARATILKQEIATLALNRKAFTEHLSAVETRNRTRIDQVLNRLAATLPPDSYITGFDVDSQRILIRADMPETAVQPAALPAGPGPQFVRGTTLRPLGDGRAERELLFEYRRSGS